MTTDDVPTAAPEHARRTKTRWRTTGLDWQGWRLGRPLIGGLVGFAVVVVFLAIRSGASTDPIDALTGTQRGGWNRLEDVHLLIVVNAAVGVGIAVTLLAEYVRSWLALWIIATFGAILLAIRELAGTGQTASDILLALVIASAVLALAVALADVARFRHRAGY